MCIREWVVRVLRNLAEIQEGDEVVLHSDNPGQVPAAKAGSSKRTRTWLDEARKGVVATAPNAQRK